MRPWALDFTDADGARPQDLPKPPGFSESSSHDADDKVAVRKGDQTQLKLKKAKELAWSPGKNFMMTAFMLWMSGTSIQIFSIYTTGNALMNPLKGIASINQVFGKFDNEEGVDTRLPKLIFVALQLLAVGVALYKCATMNLLPLTSADWLWRLPERQYEELGGVPVP